MRTKKIGLGVLIGIVVLALSLSWVVAQAKPNDSGAQKAPEKVRLESHIFIDRFQLPDDTGIASSDLLPVYKLFRGGVKWLGTPVSYSVNLDGAPDGAFDAIAASAETWDDNTGTELFDYDGPTGIVFDEPEDLDVVYFENTVSWASFADLELPEDAVAVCKVWFWVMVSPSGKVTGRVLGVAEFHIIHNSDFPWAVDAPEVDGGQFDVQNLDTHEFGHTLFLDDLYMPPAGGLTMFGYTALEETKKRDLGLGDILGLQALYGE